MTVPGVDGPWLVDVGFGGQTLSSPIRLEVGTIQTTRHEPYRVLDHGDGYLLQAQVRGEWQALYTFTRARVHRSTVKSEVGMSQRIRSLASSPDCRSALVTDDARWNLRGRNLAIHSAGDTERIRFATAADVLNALTERFGIDLTDLGDRVDVEARVSEVLDS